MSDFINQLPPIFREILEIQQLPEISEDLMKKLNERFGIELPEQEFTKTSREKK